MIKVDKTHNEDGTIIRLNDRNEKVLVICIGGNLDLYFIPYVKGNFEKTIDFEISTKDPILYDLFYNLYNNIINYEPYESSINKEELKNQLINEDKLRKYPLVNNNIVNWYSDEDSYENANLMRIYKTKDLKIKLEFTSNYENIMKSHGIRFRNSRSKYKPFNYGFMDLYNALCNYDFEYKNIDFNNVIMGTSCYCNAHSGNIVSITGDGGNAWGFFGNAYKRLSPSYNLWQYYSTNHDNLTYENLLNHYLLDFYKHRLEDLDIKQLLATLNTRFGDNIILTCHEKPGTDISMETFCHRRFIADYIELEMGIKIPEISTYNDSYTLEKIYDLKPRIKELIKK